MKFLSTFILPLFCAALDCRPEGPVVPKPVIQSLESSKTLSTVVDKFTSLLKDALSDSISAGWDTKNVSFSLALVSANQKDPGVPIWEYHHLADANKNGTTQVDRDSQYLIGSVSKLVSDYVLLQNDVDLDQSITHFIPELAEPGSRIEWDGVTLRMLAEHLAGIPTNYEFSEYYDLRKLFTSLGLPHINDSAYPPCGMRGLNDACSNQQYLDGMRHGYPVAALNERPSYSNVAFTLIYMALENATGKTYTQMIEEYFSVPLGLTSTFPSPGDDAKAVIPLGDSSWGGDYAYNAPAGGLVSSLSDLTKFAHAILSRDIPMTEAEIRGWMKPSSFAGSKSFVGMPWEIYRPDHLTPQHPRPIAVYSKSGGAVGYRAQWSLIDELGVGVIVLAAGPSEAMPLLHGAMMSTFVPAVDEIARKEAEDSYARTFVSGCSKSRSNSSTVTATITHDKDSLILKNMSRDDSDITKGLLQIFRFTVGAFGFPVVPPLRIFPSDIRENTTLPDGTRVIQEVWRIWPDLKTESNSELPGADYAKDDCMSWTFGDWVHYGGEPLDRILFYRSMDGDIVGLEAPFLRSGILQPS